MLLKNDNIRVFILDTEYLSWNKSQSSISPNKRLKGQEAEIIQFYSKEIFTKNKNELNLFIKPQYYKKYPYRITKLTSISKKFLDHKGKIFSKIYHKICNFFPKNSLIISNGDEINLINNNRKLNKLIKLNKNIYFIDFMKILKNFEPKLIKKNIHTVIKDNLMIKRHNAKDDVMQLIFLLKKLKITKKNILKS